YLDLSHTLRRHAVLFRKRLERDRIVAQASPDEDAALAIVEHAQGPVERHAADVDLLALDQHCLLARAFAYVQVLAWGGAIVLPERSAERKCSLQTLIHVDVVLLGDAHALGDQHGLIGAQVAIERGDLALRRAQPEEQLSLARRRAQPHERPRAQDVLL